jgi:two-component system KDP operon response regulator KdpE
VSNKTRVLIIDDEPPIRRFLKASFSEEEFELIESDNGREGARFIATYNPDVVLLDLGLPDIDGVELTRQVREWSSVPIIVISAREQEQDKVRALDAGANDYLTKPFGVPELLARIRVALRMSGGTPDQPVVELENLKIDFGRREVLKNGGLVHLTPIEYKLLAYLVRHLDKVLTHGQILSEVWGAAFAKQTQYLRVYMGQLRHKLEDDPARPRHLITEPAVGYRFRS